MKFSEVLAKLSNAFLNDIGKSNIFIFMPSLKLFHPWEQRGKNMLLKSTVLEAVCLTIFFSVNLVCQIELLWSLRYNVKFLGKSPYTIL